MEQTTRVDTPLSTSWGQVDDSAESFSTTVPNGTDNQVAKGQVPAHWRDDLSRMVVYRAGLVQNGVEQARKPLFEKPENIKADRRDAERQIHWAKLWWGGLSLTLEQCQMLVSGDWDDDTRLLMKDGAFGRYPGAPKDVAHMPWLDDQFVIDCDLKTYYDSPDGSPFVTNGNTATMAKKYSKYGLDDLYREAAARGMSKEELDDYLDTWTESTKSGGCHIVLGQHPDVVIDHTMHHKHEYRVDVLQNNWRGCYPSPGYTVLKDRPVKQADRRLVELLIELDKTLDPVGGKRMKKARADFKAVHRKAFRVSATGAVLGIRDESLMDRWRLGVLNVIHIAHQVGNWNDRLFWAACRYAESGWPQGNAEQDILSAAQPWNEGEKRKALDSINSAYNNVARNKGVAR